MTEIKIDKKYYRGKDILDAILAHMETVAALPAADVVEVVHGEWWSTPIEQKEAGHKVRWDDLNPDCPAKSCYCSVCGDWLTASDEYPVKGKFCPNCGAKMDEEAQK